MIMENSLLLIALMSFYLIVGGFLAGLLSDSVIDTGRSKFVQVFFFVLILLLGLPSLIIGLLYYVIKEIDFPIISNYFFWWKVRLGIRNLTEEELEVIPKKIEGKLKLDRKLRMSEKHFIYIGNKMIKYYENEKRGL